jgi:hypothetical protein
VDTAVGLVQVYLPVNGDSTVAEYPVLEVSGRKLVRTVTNLDILAIRLHRDQSHDPDVTHTAPDPALAADAGAADMMVGEVKEGTPRPNRAMRDPGLLEAALSPAALRSTGAARLIDVGRSR